MSSYYDDPDFAAEYRRRDEEALSADIKARERRPHPQCSCGRPILGGAPCAHGINSPREDI